MQTFLPYPSFERSAEVLDNKRLGKQRVECLQILKALVTGPYQRAAKPEDPVLDYWEPCPVEEYKKDCGSYLYRRTPWFNHPAARMWRGHTETLTSYGITICKEWQSRGFMDTCAPRLISLLSIAKLKDQKAGTPFWLGNPIFHAAHRSNLLRKDHGHYSQFGWTEPNDLPYFWPV